MKRKTWFLILVLFWALCLYLLGNAYWEARTEAIENLNARQALVARQAAGGMEDKFAHWIRTFEHFAAQPDVTDLNDRGHALLNAVYQLHQPDIKSLVRVGPGGLVRATFPPDERMVGQDVSAYRHFQRAKEHGRTTVSEVLDSPRGWSVIGIHVPVFKDGRFDGTLAAAVDFQRIAAEYLADIRIANSGHAWMVDRSGVELYCPVPGHTGRSVYETCRDFPSLLRLADRMLAGESGQAVYTFDRVGQRRVEEVRKHAVFRPVRIGDTFWSLVVATPEKEALAPLRAFRNKLIVILVLLILGGLLFSYWAFQAWGIIREEKRRRSAENALERTEAKYRSLFHRAPIGIFQSTSQGRYLSVNPTFAAMFGYDDPEDMMEAVDDIADLYVEPDKLAELRRLLVERGALSGYEIQVKRRDGGRMWLSVYVRSTPAPDQDFYHYDGFALDVTHRKQAEEALRVSEEKFYKAFHASPTWVVLSALEDGRYIEVNETFLKTTGFAREEVIGRTALDLETWETPAERERVVAIIKEQGYVQNEPVHRRTKSGTILSMLFSGEIVELSGREHLLSVSLDVTESKRLEDQLRQAQKMEAVGTLAGGVAHDFNNLLQVINGYVQMLSLDKPPDHPDRQGLDAIHQAGERAAQLVKQLLQFSRKMETEHQIVDLNEEVRQVKTLLERTIPRMIRIEPRLSSGLWMIEADRVALEQVILNLGNNAADAMPEGGVMTLETENVILDESFRQKHPGASTGRFVRLTVSDTGQGMDPETVEHVFEPFFTTKEVGKGTGLGLASVYGIVKSHQGYITCHSQPGHGARFTIYWPAADHKAALDDSKSDLRPEGGSERLLIVDDEPLIRDVAAQTLRRFGYGVQTAGSGEEALAAFGSGNGVDLVLLDLSMPGMGGRKCLEAILGINPAAKVLIASGYALGDHTPNPVETGAAGFISKPFQMDELLAKVRRILDKKSQPA
jgi:PAS domain S-box-containing protein